MKELAEKYGYTYSGHCNCEGFSTEKYLKSDYQLRVRVGKNLFKIKHQGRSITLWAPVSNLENTLNNIHDAAVQA